MFLKFNVEKEELIFNVDRKLTIGWESDILCHSCSSQCIKISRTEGTELLHNCASRYVDFRSCNAYAIERSTCLLFFLMDLFIFPFFSFFLPFSFVFFSFSYLFLFHMFLRSYFLRLT